MQSKEQLEELRKRNREQMPLVTDFVDRMREVFGNVKVLYAEENGRTVGIKPERKRHE